MSALTWLWPCQLYIMYAHMINLAAPLCFDKFVMVESFVWRGMSNLEWAVRFPGKIEAPTPLVAVANDIIPLERIYASNARYKNVFPVPPGPLTKSNPALPQFTLCKIILKACSCSGFNFVYASKSSLGTDTDISSVFSLHSDVEMPIAVQV